MAEERQQNRKAGRERAQGTMRAGDAAEGVGTVGGAAAGAAIGSVLGPVGTAVGAIAGGMAGNEAGEAAAPEGAGRRERQQRKGQ